MAPQQGIGRMEQQDHPRELGSSALGQLFDALLTLAQCDGGRKRFDRTNRLRLILVGKQEIERSTDLHDSIKKFRAFIANKDFSIAHLYETSFTIQRTLKPSPLNIQHTIRRTCAVGD